MVCPTSADVPRGGTRARSAQKSFEAPTTDIFHCARKSLSRINPNPNDRFGIKEGMSSAFVTYSRDLGKLNMEAGLRYENVDFKYYDDGKYMAEQSKTYGN